MVSKLFVALILILLILPGCTSAKIASSPTDTLKTPVRTLKLPEPRLKSDFSLEEAFMQRRSIREYSHEPLSLEDVSQLLWSAQGITSSTGGRTAPSAGALYPLEVYVIVGNVTDLSPGVYRYQPGEHKLGLLEEKDLRAELSQAALGQQPIANAAMDIVISAIYDRITPKYGERGIRYTHIEAGHAAQNVCLQVVALSLGTVTIGAFGDNEIKKVLDLAENEVPLYILPVGKTS